MRPILNWRRKYESKVKILNEMKSWIKKNNENGQRIESYIIDLVKDLIGSNGEDFNQKYELILEMGKTKT